MQLHHVGSSPQSIAPVTYMWRPIQLDKICSDEPCGHADSDGSRCHKHNSSHRQLWIWIHASAFDEGFEALKGACSKLVKICTNTNYQVLLSLYTLMLLLLYLTSYW